MAKIKPYVGDDVTLPELTPRVILTGILITIVLGSANAYLGLRVGMTVSATIPASVISIALFRALKGNILEINTAKAMGSAGSSLAAGIIFTVPALLIIGAWTEINFVVTMFVAMIGGTLGVLFLVSLRKILIEDLDLPYPEGVACTEVILASEKGGATAKFVFVGFAIGAAFKFIGEGLGLFASNIKGLFLRRFPLGADASLALLSVGYIIGPKIAWLVFAGACIGWLVFIPLFITVHGIPGGVNPFDAVSELYWKGQTVWIGIGAVITGGIYTLFSMKDAMKRAITEGFSGTESLRTKDVPRTQQDLPLKTSYLISAAMVIPLFIVYYYISGSVLLSGVSSVLMLVAAFFFTAIAGYLAGVVGSSNNPISSVTLSTILFTSLLLLSLGARGEAGMALAILVGSVVCCSAAIAGDVMQDLKTGQLIGSTPKNLQLAEWIAVMAMAIVIGPVIALLTSTYGIGEGSQLMAPQAYVMGTLVRTLFGGQMNFIMFLVGIELAVLFILLRIPVLPVAIGIYLPFSLSIPILSGGLIRLAIEKYETDDKTYIAVNEKNTLLASGLIAGEALMGIGIAFLIAVKLAPFSTLLLWWPGLLIMFLICIYFLSSSPATISRIGLKK